MDSFNHYFVFSSFFFLFGVTRSVRIRQLKISRLYFVFFVFFSSFFGGNGSVRIRRLKISRHYFLFLFLYFLFHWCNWVCSDETVENFSSQFCFSLFILFFGVTGSVLLRQLKISRHYFVFCFVFCFVSLV